jgi:hypothetical protein
MAQAFVMTATEPWVGDRRTLWVVLADTPIWLWKRPALMAAMLTRSSERCPSAFRPQPDLAGAARPGPGLFTENKSSEVNGPSSNSLRSR